MSWKGRPLIWQVPLTVLASIAGSLVIVWMAGRAMGFTMNPSLVAVLSAVLSAAAMTVELRAGRKGADGPAGS